MLFGRRAVYSTILNIWKHNLQSSFLNPCRRIRLNCFHELMKLNELLMKKRKTPNSITAYLIAYKTII